MSRALNRYASLALAAILFGCGAEPPARYVGRTACTSCHAAADSLWSGSDHDLAMQVASDTTVLGDFSGATFDYYGVQTRFTRRNGRFVVETDDAEGVIRSFEISHTFGVWPLQQYLVSFPSGRKQALSITWDSRSLEDGGQRWFHLYPDEPIRAGDPLHWTGPFQNWNTMCATCHSTRLEKQYDLESDTFDTSFSEINVSCEACHGPGSKHVDWAEGGKKGDSALDVNYPARDRWQIDPETGSAEPHALELESAHVDACAPCHSRRAELTSVPIPGAPLIDTHRPALLDEGLYFADGQIRDEVYVYGSFRQSRMYAAGVVCQDCHDPHTLRLRAPGNALCATCHDARRFDRVEHHGHELGTTAALCETCHMPGRVYMGVDDRADHRLGVPRPVLSHEVGAPDVCAECHAQQTPKWAESAIATWETANRRSSTQAAVETTPPIAVDGADAVSKAEVSHAGRSARAIAAGRAGSLDAPDRLLDLIGDASLPAIQRGTAFSLIGQNPDGRMIDAIRYGIADPDPVVRLAATGAAGSLEPPLRVSLLVPLLDDTHRAVRLEAVRLLAAVGYASPRFEQVLAEYVAAERLHLERPESHVNLGTLYLARAQVAAAEEAFKNAIQVGAWSAPAYVNLADLYRGQGRETDAERVLRSGLNVVADPGPLWHALGLTLVRTRRLDEAIDAFRTAAVARPDAVRFSYVLAVALHSVDRTDEAITTLVSARRRHPRDRDLLGMLITVYRDTDRAKIAGAYADTLRALDPSAAGK